MVVGLGIDVDNPPGLARGGGKVCCEGPGIRPGESIGGPGRRSYVIGGGKSLLRDKGRGGEMSGYSVDRGETRWNEADEPEGEGRGPGDELVGTRR